MGGEERRRRGRRERMTRSIVWVCSVCVCVYVYVYVCVPVCVCVCVCVYVYIKERFECVFVSLLFSLLLSPSPSRSRPLPATSPPAAAHDLPASLALRQSPPLQLPPRERAERQREANVANGSLFPPIPPPSLSLLLSFKGPYRNLLRRTINTHTHTHTHTHLYSAAKKFSGFRSVALCSVALTARRC